MPPAICINGTVSIVRALPSSCSPVPFTSLICGFNSRKRFITRLSALSPGDCDEKSGSVGTLSSTVSLRHGAAHRTATAANAVNLRIDARAIIRLVTRIEPRFRLVAFTAIIPPLPFCRQVSACTIYLTNYDLSIDFEKSGTFVVIVP